MAVGVPAALWYETRYDAWPWESVPARLSWCGREYKRSGPAVSAHDVLPGIPADTPHVLRKLSSFRTPLGLPHDVVAVAPVDERWSCTAQRRGDLTMTYVYLRVGHRFVDYDLVGGP